MNFNDLYWHDALIKKIEIGRASKEKDENISFEIEWPSGQTSTVVFEGVFHAILNMNLAYANYDAVSEAGILADDDSDILVFLSKWKGINDNIKLAGYYINGNSEIKILARSFRVIHPVWVRRRIFKAGFNGKQFVIDDDGKQAGVYICINEDGQSAHSYLQDSVGQCIEFALEEFGVPMDLWEEVS